MALVSSHTIPMLLDLMKAGKLDTSPLITHGTYIDVVAGHGDSMY